MNKCEFTGYHPKTSDKTLTLPTKGSSAVPSKTKSDTERMAEVIKNLFESINVATGAITKFAAAVNEMAMALDKIQIKAD